MDAHIPRVEPPPYMRRFFVEARALLSEGLLDLESFVRIRNAVWPEAKPIDVAELRVQIDSLRKGKAMSLWWLAFGLGIV